MKRRTEERRPGGETEAATKIQTAAGTSSTTVARATRPTPPIHLEQRRTLGLLLEQLRDDTAAEWEIIASARDIIRTAVDRRDRTEQLVMRYLADEAAAGRVDDATLLRHYLALRESGGRRGFRARWLAVGLPHHETMKARVRRRAAS